MRKNNGMHQERIRLYLVLFFFLVSGIWYRHHVEEKTILLGTRISAEELMTQNSEIFAEELLQKIDINLAGQEELMRLEGIGETLAARIIAYREKNGMFGKIEDIMKVSGIGEKTFEKIKGDITIG